MSCHKALKKTSVCSNMNLRFTSPSKGTYYCASPEASWCQQGNTLIQVQRDISCTLQCHCGMWLMLYLLNDTFVIVKNDAEID